MSASKIVVVAESFLDQWFDGVSLIVRHFLRNLPAEVACEVWSIGDPGDARELNPAVVFHDLNVPPEPRFSWFARVLGVPVGHRKADETNPLLRAACDSADAILVFSSVQSPVTNWITTSWSAKTLLHLTDCGSVHAKRSGPLRRYLRHRLMEWKAVRETLKGIVFVSPFDANEFNRTAKPVGVKAVTLPLGVDTEKFRPADDGGGGTTFTVLFSGVMSYAPNARAALFIAREILPRLPQDVRVVVAGIKPADELVRLGREKPRLVVTGAVPQIELVIREADLFLAPMFEGAGMQNKILEALASGLPVITTPICSVAFNPLPDAIEVCADADAMVDAILKLKADSGRRRKMADAARKCAEERYSWPRRCRQLLELAGVPLAQP
jgi:glycosyltransferase involved in cell wall biosynthesis